MKIAVAGARDGIVTAEQAKIFGRIWRHLGGSILLHGCCPARGTLKTDGVPERIRGVDAWAHERATARGIPVETFPALQIAIGWPRCGPERVRRMVKACDVAVAFPGGKGTENFRDFAIEFGKLLYDIPLESAEEHRIIATPRALTPAELEGMP